MSAPVRSLTAAAAVLAVALAATGCGNESTNAAPAATPASSAPATSMSRPSPSSSTSSPSSAMKPAPTGTACQVSCDSAPQYVGPTPEAPPTWGPGDQKAAESAALGAMKAYAQPGMAHSPWLAQMRPRVTAGFAAELTSFDPSYLTVSKVTGAPRTTIQKTNTYQAVVTVPTNEGAYTVTMLRSSQHSPWLATSIVPPLGQH
ncbi:hypothetical protein [Tersicoccus sp. Bi-70]|uniref:hypothetical protein n=1 Tax=Tersicoccus sp. Bi-70 TaxID=1897634 RepID=UPI0009769F40|nr:hypothetical protein [Tersicoccus sp. Bi-70]OMH32529.1 hypothetical protein BGP79_06885 [Tersicoccus sp. Bi-70]